MMQHTIPTDADDPDLQRLRELRRCYQQSHNGFYLTRADYEADVVDLSDETAAVKCSNHRTRAAVLALAGQPPLCAVCAMDALGITED